MMMTLEERLTILERRRAVLDTVEAYSRALDRGDVEGWVSCFTADGAFDVRSSVAGYYGNRRLVGHAALREFATNHSAPPQAHHKHLYMLPEMTVDGDSARVEGYFAHLIDEDGRPLLRSSGRYLDSLVLGSNGCWLIAERVAEIEAYDRAAPRSQIN